VVVLAGAEGLSKVWAVLSIIWLARAWCQQLAFVWLCERVMCTARRCMWAGLRVLIVRYLSLFCCGACTAWCLHKRRPTSCIVCGYTFLNLSNLEFFTPQDTALDLACHMLC
jgi:hypothetical protein